jgi:hypothetical protein
LYLLPSKPAYIRPSKIRGEDPLSTMRPGSTLTARDSSGNQVSLLNEDPDPQLRLRQVFQRPLFTSVLHGCLLFGRTLPSTASSPRGRLHSNSHDSKTRSALALLSLRNQHSRRTIGGEYPVRLLGTSTLRNKIRNMGTASSTSTTRSALKQHWASASSLPDAGGR